MKKFMKKLNKFISVTKKVCNIVLTVIGAYESITNVLAY